MKREMMLWGLIIMAVASVVILWQSQDEMSPGAILIVAEPRVTLENEELPTSPAPGQFPEPIYLNAGEEVRLIFDPVYEYSVDAQGRPIKTRTPFRKVEVEILTGPHEGSSGFVPRNSLSRQ